MILVYGRLDDPPTASVLAALRTRACPVCMLDQQDVGSAVRDLRFAPGGIAGTVACENATIALGDIEAVFARPLELDLGGVAPAAADDAQRKHEGLVEWLDATPARVINRPAAMQSNASKPLQLQLIGAAGLAVPDTLVTSDAREAHAFWAKQGRVIFKSTSGIRSIVRELDRRYARRLGLLASLPVQFQAYVPGVDVRVHVVGAETFAVEIRTDAIDYRYASRDDRDVEFVPVTLPAAVAQRCVAVTAALGLTLAGIDLRRRPDGEYVCFEVNPMPAFSYFERHSGLPIGDAVARWLVGENRIPREDEHGARGRQPDRDRRTNHRHPAAPVA